MELEAPAFRRPSKTSVRLFFNSLYDLDGHSDFEEFLPHQSLARRMERSTASLLPEKNKIIKIYMDAYIDFV
jgi:hypothetical protein